MFSLGPVSRLVENIYIEIYSDTVYVIDIKLCLMALLFELYLFIPLSVTLTIFQGRSNVKEFQLKTFCSYPIKLKLCRIVK